MVMGPVGRNRGVSSTSRWAAMPVKGMSPARKLGRPMSTWARLPSAARKRTSKCPPRVWMQQARDLAWPASSR